MTPALCQHAHRKRLRGKLQAPVACWVGAQDVDWERQTTSEQSLDVGLSRPFPAFNSPLRRGVQTVYQKDFLVHSLRALISESLRLHQLRDPQIANFTSLSPENPHL